MLFPETGLLLAGFVLAHAACNVSDLPEGESLCPFAIAEKDGERRLLRFEAETQEEAIENGKRFFVQAQVDSSAVAFVREGILTLDGRRMDVLVIDFWVKEMKNTQTIVQEFQPYVKEGRFKILNSPMLLINGEIQEGHDVKEALSILYKGVQTHSQVAPLWSSWTDQ